MNAVDGLLKRDPEVLHGVILTGIINERQFQPHTVVVHYKNVQNVSHVNREASISLFGSPDKLWKFPPKLRYPIVFNTSPADVLWRVKRSYDHLYKCDRTFFFRHKLINMQFWYK